MIEALAFDMGPGGFAFLALVILAASFVRGYSGFGFSAVLVYRESWRLTFLILTILKELCGSFNLKVNDVSKPKRKVCRDTPSFINTN